MSVAKRNLVRGRFELLMRLSEQAAAINSQMLQVITETQLISKQTYVALDNVAARITTHRIALSDLCDIAGMHLKIMNDAALIEDLRLSNDMQADCIKSMQERM